MPSEHILYSGINKKTRPYFFKNMDNSLKNKKAGKKKVALSLNSYANGHHVAALKSVHFMDEQQDEFSNSKNHMHHFYELVVVLRGEGFHFVENQKMPVCPGSVFLLCPGEYHYYEYSKPLALLNFMFDLKSLRSLRTQLLSLPGYEQLFRRGTPKMELYVDSATLAQLDVLLNTIATESRQQMPWSDLLLTANLINTLVLIFQKTSQEESIHANSDISSAVSYMLRNFHKDIQLPQLSRLANLSESSFYRKFHREFRMPPMKWLLKLRIHKAMEFLIRSDMTIAKIATATGFSDPLYFSRQFRKIVGSSPRSYRSKDHGSLQVVKGNRTFLEMNDFESRNS